MPGNGCMTKTNPNRVYQTLIGWSGSTPIYQGYNTQYSEWTVQYDITQYPCYTWTQTAANGCYIKFSSSSSTLTQGNYGNFTGYSGNSCQLPLDEYTLGFCAFIGMFFFFHIRRKPSAIDPLAPNRTG
ncbi:hypothetical protein VRU48_10765 [Pedobacter sp. KR3-3]|uniref:Uncharacterized protein n=1 Tax=Pedobacter albus TaxID=3113905 RepID=A0ABU7I7Y7_9SPHI|nr:hypothetical protein [Pedobacter sp. KR3-3]MEE1945587.1 hypothetical protein [Pedobacter sp. KR3-3]